MLGHTSLPIIDTLITILAITTASITTSVYTTSNNSSRLLIYLISGYVCSITTIIKLVTYLRRPYTIPIVLQFLGSAYHIGYGILLIVSMITQDVSTDSNIPHWEIIVPTFFVITVFFIALSCGLSSIQYIYSIEDHHSSDLESVSTEKSPVEFSPHQDQVPSLFTMGKKVSDVTLIESKMEHKPGLIRDIDQEPSELAFYIKTSIENPDHDQQYLAYTNNNWMDSTGQLDSLKAYEDISSKSSYSDFSRARRGSLAPGNASFKLFGNTRSNLSIGTGAIVQKDEPRRSFTNYRDSTEGRRNSYAPKEGDFKTIKSFKSVPTFRNSKYDSHFVEQESSLGVGLGMPQSKSKNSLLTVITDESSESPVKRSKSTSFIGKKTQRKEQRWKSIHDERIFLSNVDESLLPPVLKKGESPIMQIKRQQELFEIQAQGTDVHHERVATEAEMSSQEEVKAPAFCKQTQLQSPQQPFTFSHLSPVGEVEPATPDDENLPHINEFGEPVEAVNFHGFDQDYVLSLPKARNKGKYYFGPAVDQQGPLVSRNNHEPDTSDQHEDPLELLAGLEKIPNPTRNVSWFKEEHSGLNNISLKEWDDNIHLYHQARTRSGVNLNIPGITRLVSDHNLNPNTADPNSSFLLPPLENRTDDLDNIDSLSEAFAPASTRSFSAPSLHTFRNLSGNYEDDKESEQALPDPTPPVHLEAARLTLFRTPPDTATATASSSPIKKLLESPKRLGSVFRKKSGQRRSMDDYAERNHKHTSSMISNQLSIASLVSSRSGLPKKSLKSYLTIRSHKHSESMASVQITKPVVAYDTEAIDFWDLDTNQSSDKSRVSSIPSVVIGEYDREKWRTLKALAEAGPVASKRDQLPESLSILG
ncbi:uncharacterized protein CANTADRAFT_22344 [Suhomyces tanzawaensis NRRL Y-17324]|uniref:Uncharacterized protein n=1 Tax=Suhomyces tanzawaensis NRRL Y-17324 TaxID=984487 RepID=A0A1E4SFP6_9ASCO|nr:uncharacterized protein CANTADRAFT_22344 [Suhomyces tanzawaensis NRRL Y-17324]ODV78331.1 hypothetical protein CANTADRAFT_22344 [Suhomyces tanzawaensis NRRL Y-17324]